MHMGREKNIYKHSKPSQIQMNPMQPIQAKTMHHQHFIDENPKIAKEFVFYYSHLIYNA